MNTSGVLYDKHIRRKKIVKKIQDTISVIKGEVPSFLAFLNLYFRDKTFAFLSVFEANKNTMVKSVLIKRGKRNRIFLHLSAMSVLAFGIVVSPFISDSSFFANDKNTLSFAETAANEELESLTPDDVFQTEESEKPRDKVVEYSVQKGDTISTIARKFGISEDTIRWENNLKTDDITVGDSLRILPVTGVLHKVERGDTVYSIAKKYTVNPQEIVDFPFNDFANPQTFSLVEGQMLTVPNGVNPEDQEVAKPKPKPVVRIPYIASGPVETSTSGFTWPMQGGISQYYSWYHKGLDITNPTGTPIVSSQNGTVSEVYVGGWNWGYGTHVIISGDNGYSTLYAHMSGVNVSVGDRVSAGSTVVGWVGMTGRTTGPHLHLEVRGPNGNINPLSVLR